MYKEVEALKPKGSYLWETERRATKGHRGLLVPRCHLRLHFLCGAFGTASAYSKRNSSYQDVKMFQKISKVPHCSHHLLHSYFTRHVFTLNMPKVAGHSGHACGLSSEGWAGRVNGSRPAWANSRTLPINQQPKAFEACRHHGDRKALLNCLLNLMVCFLF